MWPQRTGFDLGEIWILTNFSYDSKMEHSLKIMSMTKRTNLILLSLLSCLYIDTLTRDKKIKNKIQCIWLKSNITYSSCSLISGSSSNHKIIMKWEYFILQSPYITLIHFYIQTCIVYGKGLLNWKYIFWIIILDILLYCFNCFIHTFWLHSIR